MKSEDILKLKKALATGKPIPAKSFEHVKVGDTVVRLLGGMEMPLLVTKVTDKLIEASVPQLIQDNEEGWSFDRKTGAEVDEELGWGPKHGITGSYLLRAVPAKDAV